jgi:hypothetical protein
VVDVRARSYQYYYYPQRDAVGAGTKRSTPDASSRPAPQTEA